MAVGAEKVGPLSGACKKPGSFSMDPCSPGFIDVPMTFATEPVAFCEVDELPVIKPQFIPISCFVAVKAPSHRLGMMQFDIRVFILQFPLFPVHLHRGMAVAAGKHAFCHGRRGDREFLTCPSHKGDKTDP